MAGVPFTTFNFRVLLELPGSSDPVCAAAFSECDGLDMSMAQKTIREGGNNARQIHLAGPVSYGQLTLKRGMSEDFGLWSWFSRTQAEPSLRASGEVHVLAPDRQKVQVRFALTGCLPVKIKAPSLSAKDGLIAIEEMSIVYETLAVEPS